MMDLPFDIKYHFIILIAILVICYFVDRKHRLKEKEKDNDHSSQQ